MKNKILIGGLVFVLILSIPLLVWPNPDIEVVPSEHDFGNVELGSSSSTIITVTNGGWGNLAIYKVSLQAGSSPDFSITSAPAPGTVLSRGESAAVVVTYTPSALGYTSATMDIDWTNGLSGHTLVSLEGVGVESSAEVTIEEILDFFDESVIEGTLKGKGRGKSALARLFVLRKMIERAGRLIDRGRIRLACWRLWRAYRRCDGLRWPPDFVVGESKAELNGMILQLMADMGCN